MKKNIKNLKFNQSKAPYECEVLELDTLLKTIASFTYFGKTERLHFYLVFVITEGSGKHFVDFKEYHLEKGSILFIAPGQIQEYKNHPDYKGYMLLFTEDFFRKQPNDLAFLHQSTIFDTSISNALVMPDPETFSQMLLLIEVLKKEISSSDSFAVEESLQKLVSLFLIYGERQKQKTNTQIVNHHYLSQYYHFKQLLERHFSTERSVDFYASVMAVTPKTLNRICQSSIQKSAKEFIDSRIIIEIKRLLVFEKLSVKEIAYSLNFNEPTNLVKYFKKHTGTIPSLYKK
ncbi:helix-turn-helix transcriptional regulator [Chryseobacterium sp.]|uniref:helix-turn-helix domain-containing protein n=1 Tax=Chryseobacterium sp. TaxID=1871047 RepID=UPI0025BC7C68|nr:helix-turn-helix transcriptional regulator [Chryseobacterium sp.]